MRIKEVISKDGLIIMDFAFVSGVPQKSACNADMIILTGLSQGIVSNTAILRVIVQCYPKNGCIRDYAGQGFTVSSSPLSS